MQLHVELRGCAHGGSKGQFSVWKREAEQPWLMSVDRFLRAWNFEDHACAVPGERARADACHRGQARKFWCILRPAGEAVPVPPRKQRRAWDEAFSQVILVQQSTISKLIDACEEYDSRAKALNDDRCVLKWGLSSLLMNCVYCAYCVAVCPVGLCGWVAGVAVWR